MRISNRRDFLTLPAGTVFMKFPSQPADGKGYNFGYTGKLEIKEGTLGNAFVTQELVPWFEGASDSNDFDEILIAMLEGKPSPAVDYDFAGRDGLDDNDQLFLVWDRADQRALIDRLNQALAGLASESEEKSTK